MELDDPDDNDGAQKDCGSIVSGFAKLLTFEDFGFRCVGIRLGVWAREKVDEISCSKFYIATVLQ